MRLGSLVLAGLVLIGGAALAATGDPLLVTGDGVNVRFEPTTDSRIRMRVYRNQQVVELERQGDWVRVEVAGTGGEEGWIHGSLLAPPDGEEIAPPPGSAAAPAPSSPQEAPALETRAIPVPRPADAPPEGAGDVADVEPATPAPAAARPAREEPRAVARPAVPTAAEAAAPSVSPEEGGARGEGAALGELAARSEAAPSAMPEPAAGPEAAQLGGLARFREAVAYLNGRAQEVAGVNLFTGVQSKGGGVVQVVATNAWSTVPPAGRRSYLNTLLDRWTAASGGGDRPVSVQIVDESGAVVMEKSAP